MQYVKRSSNGMIWMDVHKRQRHSHVDKSPHHMHNAELTDGIHVRPEHSAHAAKEVGLNRYTATGHALCAAGRQLQFSACRTLKQDVALPEISL